MQKADLLQFLLVDLVLNIRDIRRSKTVLHSAAVAVGHRHIGTDYVGEVPQSKIRGAPPPHI